MFYKSFGQTFSVVGFVYVHSREGPSFPLWVKFLEVKVVNRIAEPCLVWFHQDVCPLSEEMFYNVRSFPQGLEIFWP